MNEQNVEQTGGAVKRRAYRSSVRTDRAAATRHRVLAAARDLLIARGYHGTTMADIGRRADVALDTVYAVAGKKPDLLRELVETAISGQESAVDAEQRDYVIRARAAPSARGKLDAYADGIAAIQPRLAPIFLVLRAAAAADPECATLWAEISERRAAGMRRFASELIETGELRPDLDVGTVADVLWSMNSAEYFQLLSSRGWDAERYRELLVEMWSRTFLA